MDSLIWFVSGNCLDAVAVTRHETVLRGVWFALGVVWGNNFGEVQACLTQSYAWTGELIVCSRLELLDKEDCGVPDVCGTIGCSRDEYFS